MRDILRRSWNSPTITAWAGFVSRTGSLLFVLPLVLRNFGPTEVSVFFLLSTLINLVQMLDFGFGPTFSRLLAYGRGGRSKDELENLRQIEELPGRGGEPNWDTIEALALCMRRIYSRIALAVFGVLCLAGPLLMARPISASTDPFPLWCALGVVLVSSPRLVARNYYSAYLNGLNHVVLVNRWQVITGSLTVLSSFGVLLAGGGVLSLVISTQFWGIVEATRNRWLARAVDGGRMTRFVSAKPDPQLMGLVWSNAWRVGISSVVFRGYNQTFGLVLAQFGSAPLVASYLLAVRIVEAIKGFSMAGFSPKLPRMASLRAAGKVAEQMRVASRSMRMAHWAFVVPALLVGVLAPTLLHWLGSDTPFVPLELWSLLALSEYLTRFASMHLWLYQITGHVVIHRFILSICILQAIACYTLFPWLGVYAFPVGSILGVLVPLVFICRMSYRSICSSFAKFELPISGWPAVLLFAFVVVSTWRGAH